MSFFKDFKDGLDLATSELEVEQTAEEEDDLFALLSESEDVEVDQELLEDMLEEEKEEVVATEEAQTTPVENTVTEQAAPATVPAEEEKPLRERSTEDSGATTVITKGTTINGSIISDCSLEVMGTINGDIECLGKLTISGKVTGNSIAADVDVKTERLKGSIVSEGYVNVGLGTIVIGDITATSAKLSGAVKGEIDVKGPVILDSTAIIKGNIKAKSVQMNNGAVLEGFCSLTYSDLQLDDIFE